MQIIDVPKAAHEKGIAHPRTAELDATAETELRAALPATTSTIGHSFMIRITDGKAVIRWNPDKAANNWLLAAFMAITPQGDSFHNVE
jgi:hypothetical protein